MTDFTHDDVLTPLAITVIIDTKVKEPEIAEFCVQATHLLDLFELEALSEAALRAWLARHQKTFEDKLQSARKNTFVLRILTRFKEDLHVENIYDAMVSISVSDNEYRKEESELVKSAASIWGYERPPLKVIR